MMLCTENMECDAGVLMCTELCAGIYIITGSKCYTYPLVRHSLYCCVSPSK